MTRDETVALFLQGREAWNKWANEMLAEKKRLEDVGLWRSESNAQAELEPDSLEARVWRANAEANFERCYFLVELNETYLSSKEAIKTIQLSGDGIDFSDFIFPSSISFLRAYFTDEVFFANTTFADVTIFSLSTFSGPASFDGADFNGPVSFSNSTLMADVSFRKVSFAKPSSFSGATFRGDAFFSSAHFTSPASFSDATFIGDAAFRRATFQKSISFENAAFKKSARFIEAQFCQNEGKADFFQATFRRFVSFRGARFFRDGQFTAISADRAFDLRNAMFEVLPDFTQANFKEAPRLDNLKLGDKVEPGSFWRSLFRQTPASDDVIANYRSLRRLAIQAHDHANEQKFLKGEIRTRRNAEDKIWHFAWWSGVLYDAISDFGRSMARPLWIWIVSAAGFAALYLALSVNGIAAPACALGNPGSPVLDALYLAYKNALLVIGWESEQKLNQVHACLYGQPQAPSGIALIQLGQNLISAAVLFLLLLGVRNRFKIK